MKSKKGKAIAAKLIDDLLGSNNDETKESSEQESTYSKFSELDSDQESGILELSESIITDEESQPFGVAEGLASDSEDDPDATLQVRRPSKNSSAALGKTELSKEPDATIKLSESRILKEAVFSDEQTKSSKSQNSSPESEQTTSSFQGLTSSHIKATVGRYAGAGGVSSPTQATLVQSENLRIAQQKILELEEEISRLRTSNEDLAAAGETLQKVVDESKSEGESLERKMENFKEMAEQENLLLKEAFEVKKRRVGELENKIEEMELRLSSNIQKIRVRERELENRLELVRMEGQALARSKDEMVLDLKRQIDQLNVELENYRSKGQELNTQLKDKQELLRRTVKALRLALSMLEGDEFGSTLLKKVK